MNPLRAVDVASMLRRRIQLGVHLGLVKPGDRLPSLRAASHEFGVDQRSVLAAYRELEREGIVVMRPRSGIYVAPDRQCPPALPGAARWLSEMFLQGFSRGIPPARLGATLTGAMATELTAACLECNADQILWMAGQLRNEFGLSTTWIETTALESDTMADRLRGSDFIVTTSFHAPLARELGDQYGLPVIITKASRDEATHLRAELGRGPVYLIGTDERYARKLLEMSDGARWMSNLRPLVVDQLKETTIPDDGPVVVTQAAAEILGDKLPRGAAVLDYPFASEARGEIIAVMLSAYLKAQDATAGTEHLASGDRAHR